MAKQAILNLATRIGTELRTMRGDTTNLEQQVEDLEQQIQAAFNVDPGAAPGSVGIHIPLGTEPPETGKWWVDTSVLALMKKVDDFWVQV